MPDLDAALDELRGLVSRPPSQTPDVGEVQAGAHRRRNRRWATSASLAVVIALTAVTLAWVVPADDDTVDVIDEPTTFTTTATTLEPFPPGLTIEPSSGLDDGDTVRVTGNFMLSNIVGAALCAEEGRQEVDRLAWCDLSAVSYQNVDGVLEVTVSRRIVTQHGVFDCAERLGRCLLGVRDNQGVDRSAPISFRDDLGPLEPETISLSADALADGELVEVIGQGWQPDALVELRQCLGEPIVSANEVYDSGRCDLARPLAVTADGSGWLRIGYLAYEQIYTGEGWEPCDPCALVATSGLVPPVATTITVEALGDPILPSLSMSPSGPYRQGQIVSVEGTGFQAGPFGAEYGNRLWWCAAPRDDPDQLRMLPDHEGGPCGSGTEAEGVVVGADGTFRVDEFTLAPRGESHADLAALCAPSSEWACAVGLYGAFVPIAGALAPFEIVG